MWNDVAIMKNRNREEWGAMETVSERILKALTEKDMSYGELSKLTDIPKSSLQRYATSKTNKVPIDVVEIIASVLNIPATRLMGWDAPPTVTKDYVAFPIIGEVAAGYEHFAEADQYGSVDIPQSWLKGRKASDYFVLRVSGDSMYPLYQDGDLVLVLKQSTMNHSGEVGVFIYDDDKATLKKIEYVMGQDWVRLVPINPNYPPQMIRDEALEHCRVLGIPKRLIREINQ